MSYNSNTILRKAEAFATTYLKKEVSDKLVYHSFDHTCNVVNAADEIARYTKIDPEEYEIVILAAWFHDLGYSEGIIDHEKFSCTLARTFLLREGYPEEKIQKVENCILATRMPQTPNNILEQIICDADMTHLSREDYMRRAELLRQEIENVNDKKIDRLTWLRMSRVFIQDHTFFTDYAQKNFSAQAKENLDNLSDEINKLMEQEKSKNPTNRIIEQPKEETKKPKKKNKGPKKPDRGIETMFRLASKNHIDLSAMADTKANIMISINSIILSVLVSILIRKLEQYPHFVIPGILLTLVCLTTIIFSILATRPTVPGGKFTEEDIEKQNTNLLFFGNFYKSDIDLYLKGMKQMMNNSDFLYSSLIRDIYYLGIVLGKKYRLLRIGYTIFMFGFVISILSFIIAELYFKTSFYPH